jgi:nucleoside-diphosphate-sugar epimerase
MSFYLVTGAAGFIGSKIAERLLAQGHQVLGIDNLNDAYDPRLKFWRLEQLKQHSGFDFASADISERQGLAKALRRIPVPEAVINLAARAGVRQSVANPWVYIETNATGTLNLLEYCRETGVPKFILASTSSLYGLHNPMPYREDADTSCPLSPYAASKKAAEVLCHSWHHLHGLNVTVFRYFTVYGPAGRPDMSVFRFVQWVMEGHPVTLYGDGSQSRDFTYVDDIAAGTVAALPLQGFQVINLGSDRPVRLIDILHRIERLTGRQANLDIRPAHSADVPATWADVTRAQQLLGWKPETPWEQGIGKAVEWYVEHRSWAREIDTADFPKVQAMTAAGTNP